MADRISVGDFASGRMLAEREGGVGGDANRRGVGRRRCELAELRTGRHDPRRRPIHVVHRPSLGRGRGGVRPGGDVWLAPGTRRRSVVTFEGAPPELKERHDLDGEVGDDRHQSGRRNLVIGQ